MTKTGKIRYFDKTRGFGFIDGDDGESIFVHISDISSNGGEYPEVGQEVSYTVGKCKKGTKAVDVILSVPTA